MIRLFKPEYPLVAFEVSSSALTMIRLSREEKELRLEDFSVTPLEPGDLNISMVDENVARESHLTELIRRAAVRSGGGKSNKVAVVLSDSAAKVSVLEMESAPRNRKEMDRLISWQLKKVTPFPIEEGRVGYHRFGRPGGDANDDHIIRVLVTIIRTSVLRQYERCFAGAGLHAGLVDISTNNLYNLFHAKIAAGSGEADDCLLVNCEDDGICLVMLHGGVPILYRAKGVESVTGVDDYDYERVIREIRTSVLYYQEKLQRSALSRVLVRGTGFHIRGLRDQLEAEMDIPVEVLDPAGVIPVRPGLTLEPGTIQKLAPAIGAAMGR
jgi:Tfp pilus assembly PilM family ATPase